MQNLILETTEKLFSKHCTSTVRDEAEVGAFPETLWNAFQDAGLHLLGTAESGTSIQDAYALMRLAGRYGVPLPIPEILISNYCVGEAGITTVAEGAEAPWGRVADRVLFPNGDLVTSFSIQKGTNIAGEPRDTVIYASSKLVELPSDFDAMMALGRTVSMSGAMERILELTLQYASERNQFGRALSKFQAIQHNLAVLAGETAASQRGADAAIESIDTPWFRIQVGSAKARVGEAAGTIAEIAHQIHGAMGFTHEHELHQFTRRLWAWREEHGNESVWRAELGRRILEVGADQVWAFLTRSL